MRALIILSLVLAAWLAQSCSHGHSLTVVNDSDIDRTNEIVELDYAQVKPLVNGDSFRLLDAEGQPVAYQLTHDGKLIFPATVGAHASTRYSIEPGEPVAPDTLACGAFYERRKDDLAWENDRMAFRAYGPALQASGEQAYGYDVWTKSVSHPVVARRYSDALDRGISFHEDHGDGMDVYTVGPTLGAGTAALVDSMFNIVYPYCFESYEIIDNGPLRFAVRLNYTSPSDSTVSEQRTITLDSGEYLNRTEVCITDSSTELGLAPGIVVHRQNPDGFTLMPEYGVMAYADLTDNATANNGIIYIGVVAPAADTLLYKPFDTPRGDALGHILAKSKYNPGDNYTYYWGAGWSKGSMPDSASWSNYLVNFRARLDNPLKISIE